MKPGYKQTEVGVILEEWEVKPLAAISDKIMVGIASAATHAYRTKGVPMFRNQNIKNGHLDDSDLLFVDPEYEAVFKNKRLRSGDLLTMRTGYPGVTAIVPPQYDSAQSFTTLITRPKQREAESAYLCHFINSEIGQQFFTQSQIGGAQKNVNAGTLRQMLVPLPKPIEQRAIATALSDVDGLLGALDRLIAKKRDLKQAAMQQLLTGQTRLPGFKGEWVVKTLGDAFTISAGKSKSAFIVVSGDYLICDMGSVSTEGRLIVSKQTNFCGDFLDAGDLIMPKDDIGGGKIIGKVAYIDADDTYVLGDHVYCLRALAGDSRFLSYTINSHRINGELKKKVIGSAQLGLGRRSVTDQEIPFPPLPEQTAIATVLSDMDLELAALEQRREKTRALKQGMMQELLTGRTRLVESGKLRVDSK